MFTMPNHGLNLLQWTHILDFLHLMDGWMVDIFKTVNDINKNAIHDRIHFRKGITPLMGNALFSNYRSYKISVNTQKSGYVVDSAE